MPCFMTKTYHELIQNIRFGDCTKMFKVPKSTQREFTSY